MTDDRMTECDGDSAVHSLDVDISPSIIQSLTVKEPDCHVQTPSLLAVSPHAVHRPGVDHQRDAGRGHDDRGQQRDVRLHHRDAGPHPRHPLRPGRSSRAAWTACPTPSGTWSRSARSPATSIEGMTPTVVGAGDAQLPVRRAVDHPAGAARSASTRRRRASVSDFGKYLQHPENRRADELRPARGRLRHARPPGRAAMRPSGRRWPTPAGAAAGERRRIRHCQQDDATANRRSDRSPKTRGTTPYPATTRTRPVAGATGPIASRPGGRAADVDPFAAGSAERDRVRPGQGAAHRASCWASPWPAIRTRRRGRGPLPGPAGRRREADLSHGRHAAEGRSATTSRSSTSTKAR